ncbi:MAG: type VI secretion system ImpA family N-terminal domain-containing protein [Novosphingobium sp.]
MALDIAALVAPLSDEQPSGPDLCDDPERMTIEDAFSRSVSDDNAEESSASEWRTTIKLIIDQCNRTRDLWLAAYLMRAAARSGQMDLLVDGARLLAALMEERWADVHPQLEELGFIGRKTPCESLTRIAEFLGPLERCPLLKHSRLGQFSGADLIRLADQGSQAADYGSFRAVVDATPADELEALLAQMDDLRDAIRRTDTALTANADGDTATNFAPTHDMIGKIRAAVAALVPGAVVVAASPAEAATSAGASAPSATQYTAAASSFSGSISSRDDVVKALDAICAYYAHFEPASPVPFVLRRAKDWISLDFMAVLADIAPGSLDEATRVLKTRTGESNDGGGVSWGSSDTDSQDDTTASRDKGGW